RKYRSAEELERDKLRDPIPKFERFLIENGISSSEQLDEIKELVAKEVNEVADWAESQPQADPSTVELYVYSPNQIISIENFVEKKFEGPNVVMV
ncbi:MAG: thiamine pyrophosphate-dependent enzyme, partial [Deltaproteobacteria bacterium]|nr:thiamine pyrophosphate-dependent enzyme [Deltaproteobacteria bacterium]